MVGAAAGNFLEDHNMSLPAVLSVAGIVLPATWWISRRLAKIDSKFELTESRMMVVEERVKNSLDRIETAVAALHIYTAERSDRPKIRPHDSKREP